MKVFTYGVDQLTVNLLKEKGYEVIIQNKLPEPEMIPDAIIMVTSEVISLNDLAGFTSRYRKNKIIYHYMTKGIRGYQQVHATCERLGIHFLSPRATSTTYLEKLLLITQVETDQSIGNLIGFFGSGPGIGCTSTAATFAKKMALDGKKVIMLGLDLYEPGYDGDPTISLDKWRPRITGKIIQKSDFDQLIKKDSFYYLPGNYDYMGSQDYQEEEIEYLLTQAQQAADIVIADFGSIPESAAWYVGMQKSNMRILVTHPSHRYRTIEIFKICKHLDLFPTDFSMVVNRFNNQDLLTAKSLAVELGIELMIEFPHLELQKQSVLGLGKRESQLLDQEVRNIMVALGLKEEPAKKRGWMAQ